MSEWRKVINSSSQAELESLHIIGEIATPSVVALQVNASDIRFHNLPTSDPHNPGQLWKDNSDGNTALSYIRVSAE